MKLTHLKRLRATKAVLIDFETQVVKVGRSPSFKFCCLPLGGWHEHLRKHGGMYSINRRDKI